MIVFGVPGRLVSWARRCPQTRQSGQKNTTGKAGKGNPWLNGILGEIAASASRTDTFLGERYRGRPPLCGVHCDGGRWDGRRNVGVDGWTRRSSGARRREVAGP